MNDRRERDKDMRDDDFQGKGGRDSDPLSLRTWGAKRAVSRDRGDREHRDSTSGKATFCSHSHILQRATWIRGTTPERSPLVCHPSN